MIKFIKKHISQVIIPVIGAVLIELLLPEIEPLKQYLTLSKFFDIASSAFAIWCVIYMSIFILHRVIPTSNILEYNPNIEKLANGHFYSKDSSFKYNTPIIVKDAVLKENVCLEENFGQHVPNDTKSITANFSVTHLMSSEEEELDFELFIKKNGEYKKITGKEIDIIFKNNKKLNYRIKIISEETQCSVRIAILSLKF
jgi:hypothetical protein